VTKNIAKSCNVDTIKYYVNNLLYSYVSSKAPQSTSILTGVQVMLDQLNNNNYSVDILSDVILSMLKFLLNSINQETISRTLDYLYSGNLQKYSVLSSSLSEQLLSMYYINDYFCTGEFLGKGQWGNVFKGYNRLTGVPVAIKKMLYPEKPDHVRKILQREIQVMKHLNHQSIIRLYDAILDKDGKYLYMVMEYCSYGDLEKYFVEEKKGNLHKDEVRHIMQELSSCLSFLHSKSIVHRDLKPANVLIFKEGDKIRLKLCDFTYAKVLCTEDLTNTLCGSPLYMAPEILNVIPYTEKSDLWSVGVIMFRLIFNDFPFNADSPIALVRSINQGELKIPNNTKIIPEAENLLVSLLQKDPYERISWPEFFMHPFMNASKPCPISLPDSSTTEIWKQKYLEIEKELNLLKTSLTEKVQEIEGKEREVRENKEKLERTREKLEITQKEFENYKNTTSNNLSMLQQEIKDLKVQNQRNLENFKIDSFTLNKNFQDERNRIVETIFQLKKELEEERRMKEEERRMKEEERRMKEEERRMKEEERRTKEEECRMKEEERRMKEELQLGLDTENDIHLKEIFVLKRDLEFAYQKNQELQMKIESDNKKHEKLTEELLEDMKNREEQLATYRREQENHFKTFKKYH